MNLLLWIVLAVVAVVLLAFLIVKFIPLKLRGLVSILLLAASVYLGYLIYGGIMEPIKFNNNKKIRYAKVIKNLRLIRDAEVKFNERYHQYSSNKAQLIQFIEKDSLAIKENYSKDTVVRIGGGLTKNKTLKKTRIIGYDKVKSFFPGDAYKQMFKVPGTEKEFTLETGEVEKVAKLMVPVFLAKAEKKDILAGMNPGLVKQELEAKENDQIKGKFVSVGSMEEITVGGNWPPTYDLGIESAKKD